MRLPRLLLGLVLGTAVAPLACGDDSSSGNPGGAGDAGETSAAGSPEPGVGGAQGFGATNGGGGDDTSLAGGATTPQGGGSDQAGAGNLADCTARQQIADPVVGTLRVPSACKAPAACGGTLSEGKWAYSDVCVDAASVFEPIYTECPTSKLSGPADIIVDGTLELSGDEATHHAVVSATGVFQIPAECAACDCKGIQDVFKRQGAGPNTYCYPDCYPDNSCRCLVDFAITIDDSGAYSAVDHTLTLGGGKKYEFCATATGLTLTEPGAAPTLPGTASLIPFAQTITPEICDGIDNDKDGNVDNEPQDCPATPCNGKGVCAGIQSACVGGYWGCDYSGIDSYEMTSETTCDGLDNDCDGEVDEGLVGCYEKCDGLDNDNDGTVDDDPQDNPCGLAKLGVCATGVTATCLGKAGWQCDFDAKNYEPEESTCGDGLDNDCDGQVDEGCSCPLGKSQMFVVEWGTSPALLRADLDGGNAAPIAALSGFALGQVAVDAKNDKLYWSDGSNHINRSNLDGSGIELLWTGKAQTWAVNPANGLLVGECDTYNICRLNPPNTTTTLLTPASATWVNVDPVNQVIWWADYATNYDYNFAHVNVDGSALAGIGKRQLSAPLNFEIDSAAQQIYWQKGQAIYAVGTDGSNERQVAPLNNAYAYDMAVDHNGGKLYYTEVNASQVRRVGLDGKNDELLIPDVSYAVSLALYICP